MRKSPAARRCADALRRDRGDRPIRLAFHRAQRLGQDADSFYTNGKGNVIQKTGEDELLNIVGKNLNFTAAPDGVFCWAGKFADDGTPYTGWDIVTDWSYSTSKMLTDVDLDPDCGGANPGPGMKSAIMVEFDHGVIGDPTDDTFVVGPSIYVKPGT